mgnify:CR=1 FL=1
MSNYLEDLFLRVVEMEKEAIPGSDSVGYFFYWQEAFLIGLTAWVTM